MHRLKALLKKPAPIYAPPPPSIQNDRPPQKPTIRFKDGTKIKSTFRGSLKPPLRPLSRPSSTHPSASNVSSQTDAVPVDVDAVIEALLAEPFDANPTVSPHGDKQPAGKSSKPVDGHRSLLPQDQRGSAARTSIGNHSLPHDAWLDQIADAQSPEELYRVFNSDLPERPSAEGPETAQFAALTRRRGRSADNRSTGLAATLSKS